MSIAIIFFYISPSLRWDIDRKCFMHCNKVELIETALQNTPGSPIAILLQFSSLRSLSLLIFFSISLRFLLYQYILHRYILGSFTLLIGNHYIIATFFAVRLFYRSDNFPFTAPMLLFKRDLAYRTSLIIKNYALSNFQLMKHKSNNPLPNKIKSTE